jgi:hypothetical protein
VTSDPSGMWNLSQYHLANDRQNVSGYNVSQTLYGWSYARRLPALSGDSHH